jgi:hypothetical protein
MAAAGKWKAYENAKKYIGDGTHDLDNASLGYKMALFQSTSNCNTLSHSVYGDLTNEVANGSGYLTGGQALTNESFTQSGGTATFDVDNVVWTASGGPIAARFAVIYVDATVNTVVKPLLGVCLLDTAPADKTATDGNTLTVTINASGVFAISGATSD